MKAVPVAPGWWVASDGKWYPPETHPDAQAAAGPPQPGWWIASDGNWYPQETRPDAEVPLSAVSPAGPSDPVGDLLSTFGTLDVQRPPQPIPSAAAPARRRGSFVKMTLAVILAVAAGATGIEVTASRSNGVARSGWTNRSLHVVGTPVAGDGRVVLLHVTPSHQMQLVGVNPANGSVIWREPFSPSGITPGVQFGPVLVQNIALDLDPIGSAQNAGVYLKGIDVQTGRVAWSIPDPVEATDAPSVCNNDRDFCVTVWDTQTTSALVAIDAVDGQPVFSVQGPYRNVSESGPANANSGGVWQTSDSTPTFTWIDANGQRTWTESVDSLFGGSQYAPDNGYDLALQNGMNVGSVGVASTGNTTPLGEYKTIGIKSADGSVAWSVPGDFMCGGGLQVLATNVVCQYTGSAQSSGHALTFSGGVVLRGLDPATGALTWSRSVGDPTALSTGQNVAFSDTSHLVVQMPNGRRMLLDTENGALAPVTSSQVFWCEQTPLYRVNASTDGAANGQRASTPVFTACASSGARVASRPTTAVPSVGVTADGNFIWPSTDGLHASPLPASP